MLDPRKRPARLCFTAITLNIAVVFDLISLFNRMPGAASAPADRSQQRMTDRFRNRNLRRMLLMSALVMGGLDLFQLYLPLHGHSVGLSASTIGVILGAFDAAAFVTRALLPARLVEPSTLRDCGPSSRVCSRSSSPMRGQTQPRKWPGKWNPGVRFAARACSTWRRIGSASGESFLFMTRF